jgi:hypothetical protein
MQVELRVVHACRALGALWWALAEHRLQEGHCRRETVRRVLGQPIDMAQRRGGCEQLPGGAVWFVEHRHAAPNAAPIAQHLPMLIGAAAQ